MVGCCNKHCKAMLLLFLAAAVGASPPTKRAPRPVPGAFVVRLCEEHHRAAVTSRVVSRHAAPEAPEFQATIHAHLARLPSLPLVVLRNASAAAIAELEASHEVCGIEASRKTKLHDEDAWHMDRLNQEILPLDGDGAWSGATGAGAHIFVLDTGLDATHEEFADRDWNARDLNVASYIAGDEWAYNPDWGWDVGDDEGSDVANNDVDGHGTHCAALAAGNTVGAAPGASLHAMKVIDDTGEGETAWSLSAMDAIAGLVQDGLLSGPAVVSVSHGGYCPSGDPAWCATEDLEARAIADLRSLGVVTAVSAGNEADDACFYEPAAAAAAITVGASNALDAVAGFSNYGACVDVVAPGVDVLSAMAATGDDGDDAYALYVAMSGTSMAAPVVAGLVAVYAEATGADAVGAANALLRVAAATDVLEPPGTYSYAYGADYYAYGSDFYAYIEDVFSDFGDCPAAIGTCDDHDADDDGCYASCEDLVQQWGWTCDDVLDQGIPSYLCEGCPSCDGRRRATEETCAANFYLARRPLDGDVLDASTYEAEACAYPAYRGYWDSPMDVHYSYDYSCLSFCYDCADLDTGCGGACSDAVADVLFESYCGDDGGAWLANASVLWP